MPLKHSSFPKHYYLTDYLIRTAGATEKLNRMRKHYNKTRNEWYTNRKVKCYCCGSEKHKLYSCEQFFNWEGMFGLDFLVRSGLCSNCLAGRHFDIVCPSTDCCRVCDRMHHTLLHESYKYSMFRS